MGPDSRTSLLILIVAGLLLGGCARERRPITPTTLGTDFKRAVPGRMTPFPWPGQDIVKAPARDGSPRGFDPETRPASGVHTPD